MAYLPVPCRVAIASHRPLLRALVTEVMRGAGGAEIVSDFGSHSALMEHAARLDETKASIVLVDAARTVGMYEGILAVRTVARDCRVLVVTHASGDYVLTRAFGAGATGIVTESDECIEWRTAIETVCRGGVYQSAACVRERNNLEIACLLTAQESKVLPLVCRGQSDDAIGRMLAISPLTVEGHRCSLMRKLGVPDAAGLIALGVFAGIVAPCEIDYSARHRRSAGGDRKHARLSSGSLPS